MGERRDFTEIERMPGWAAYKSRVDDAISHLERELVTIEANGKTAEAIGLEYVRISSELEGLRKLTGITEDIKNQTDEDE